MVLKNNGERELTIVGISLRLGGFTPGNETGLSQLDSGGTFIPISD